MLKKNRLRDFLAFGFAAAFSTVAASASPITTYSYYYTAGQGSYTVAPGGNVTVPLYLQEVNSDQSANSLLANEHGLSEAGVNVSFASGSSGFTLTNATANTGTPPTGFDDPTSAGTVNSTTSASIMESTDPAPFGTDLIGVMASGQSNGVSLVYLGTVSLHASSTAGQTATFSMGVLDPNIGSTFTNDNNYDLDNNSDPLNPSGASSLYFSAASTNFTLTTSVPEPSSFLVTCAATGFLLRRKARQARSR